MTLQRSALAAALPGAGGRQERIAAAEMLAAFRPRDPIDAMLAAQAIATHGAIMEAYRLALLPETNPEAARRQRVNAAALMRCMADTLRLLERRQRPTTAVAKEPLHREKPDLPHPGAAPGPSSGMTVGALGTVARGLPLDSQQPMHRESRNGGFRSHLKPEMTKQGEAVATVYLNRAARRAARSQRVASVNPARSG